MCSLAPRRSVIAIIHSHFAPDEAKLVGGEASRSGLTSSRACRSTLFSPLYGPDHLLTCYVLALCRRTKVYVVGKVQSWSTSYSQYPHTFSRSTPPTPLSLIFFFCAWGTLMILMAPISLATWGGLMDNRHTEHLAQGAPHVLVSAVIVNTILTGCQIPASASSGGKPARESPGRGVRAGRSGDKRTLTNPVTTSPPASLFPRPAKLEIIVIIPHHICRALSSAF